MDRQRRWLLVVLAGLALAGCGRPQVKTVPLVRVGGVVTLDEEPLENGVVVFEAADGSFSYAETDERGRYDLWFDSKTRGVTPGPKTVRISTNRRIRGLNTTGEGGPRDRAGGIFDVESAERVPARYNVRSTLNVEVTDESERFDFDLESKRAG